MNTNETAERTQTLYKTAKVDDLDIFYREAGHRDAPTILLLHGSQLHRTCLEIS